MATNINNNGKNNNKRNGCFGCLGFLVLIILFGSCVGAFVDEEPAEQAEPAVSTEETAYTKQELLAAFPVEMDFDAYTAKKKEMKVSHPESISLGNGNVGSVLEAEDGYVVVSVDGEKIFDVDEFDTIEDVKAFETASVKAVEEADKQAALEKQQAEEAKQAELERQKAEQAKQAELEKQQAEQAEQERLRAEQAELERQQAEEAAQSQVSYANCTEVREAGADPIRAGEPGYSSKLDRDGDGIACDK